MSRLTVLFALPNRWNRLVVLCLAGLVRRIISILLVVCMSRTGEPVGCVGSGWTRDMDCDDFGGLTALPWTGSGEPIGRVVCTNDSSVGISAPGEPAMWESVISVVSMNRLTMMVVIPELVNRLAVFVHAGPGGWKVTITN